MADLIERDKVAEYLKNLFKGYISDGYQQVDTVDASALVQAVVRDTPAVEPAHQTAGEMFRELGYHLHPEKENCYEHAEELERIIIEDDGVWFDDDGWRFKVGIREILAVAQLIKETEATGNG